MSTTQESRTESDRGNGTDDDRTKDCVKHGRRQLCDRLRELGIEPARDSIFLEEAGQLYAFVIVQQESGGVHVVMIGEYWEMHRTMLDYASDADHPEWYLVVPIKWEIDSEKTSGLLQVGLTEGGEAA